MLKKNVLAGMLLLFVFLPAVLQAQGRLHDKWWHDETLVQDLDLTESERRELDEKYIESRRRMIDLRNEVEKQRFELDLLISTEDADEQRIMERYEILQQAKARLSKARFEMFMEVRETLGVERFQELKAMYRGRDGKGRKRFLKDRSYSGNSDRD